MKAMINGRGQKAWVILAAAAVLCFLSAGRDPRFQDRCRRDYRVVSLDADSRPSSGRDYFEVREFSNWLCDSTWKDRRVYIFRHEESTGDGDKLLWEFIMDREKLTLFQMKKTITSRNGNPIVSLEQNFTDPMYDFPERTFHMDSLPVAVLGMDLAPGARNECHILFSAENRPWRAWLLVEGEETVTVPAGRFECLRIKLEFDFEAIPGAGAITSRVIRAFMPENYIWIEKDEPHGMVRFQGRFGPPGSGPRQAHELIEVHEEEDGPDSPAQDK